MPSASPTTVTRTTAPLPDFCSAPVLFALLLLGALCATVMWLAPGGARSWSSYCVSMLLAAWLAILSGVALCKSRTALQRLPGYAPYAGVWLLIVVIVALATAIVAWLDLSLRLGLTPSRPARFVLDNSLLAALLGAALLRYFYVVAQWQARVAAATQAQVAALQARIRPHFLFNSMNTVAALVRIDPDAAERTVEDLSELFRAALGQEGHGTLADELALVERYLAIEQLRLGARLRVQRELAPPAGVWPLPRLLLQPLVENAVRHGIQPLREGGQIILRCWSESARLCLEISNPLPIEPGQPGQGHGLDNVRQRIAYHYGAAATVEVRRQDGRHSVTLRLPGEMRDARIDRR